MILKDQVVLITGAGRGIGAATADRCGAEGAIVYVSDVNRENAEKKAAEIQEAGGVARQLQIDVTDYQAVTSAIAQIGDEEGRLDVLINVAGWDRVEPFLDSQPDTWDKVIAINLYGVIHTCHAALPLMVEAGAGRIVNVASDAGRVGSKGEAVYSAAKGGVIALSKTLAREFARSGITVNAVCPGPTETPLVVEALEGNPRLLEALKKSIPMGRMGQPQDLANAIAFMASNEAAFITGQTLSVSGGLTMI